MYELISRQWLLCMRRRRAGLLVCGPANIFHERPIAGHPTSAGCRGGAASNAALRAAGSRGGLALDSRRPRGGGRAMHTTRAGMLRCAERLLP